MSASRLETTMILLDLSRGDSDAVDRLMPVVYEELRALASSYLQHQPNGHTLQPTALVNEAYLKLIQQEQIDFSGRAHFMAVAAMAMRHILIDSARRKQTEKHGGHHQRITLDEALVADHQSTVDILHLHDVLEKLTAIDERKGRVVELRFFGGLSIEETAEALGVARSTVTEDWRFARAWIVCELRGDPAS